LRNNTEVLKRDVWTVLVSNFTNIKKTNNHPSPQLYEQKKILTWEIQVLAWDRHKRESSLNFLFWFGHKTIYKVPEITSFWYWCIIFCCNLCVVFTETIFSCIFWLLFPMHFYYFFFFSVCCCFDNILPSFCVWFYLTVALDNFVF
jgi:hypothetical protein